MLKRAAVDAPEAVVVQAATGAPAAVVMTAAVPDDKPAGATLVVSPLLFYYTMTRTPKPGDFGDHYQETLFSGLARPFMDKKSIKRYDMLFRPYQFPGFSGCYHLRSIK